MSRLTAFIRLTRPQFLLGGALLYAVGAGAAGEIRLDRYLLGQAVVTAAQVTAHYVNEYYDLEADRRVVNRTFFSGGSGVLASGSLSPSVAMVAALTTTAATVVLATWLSLIAPAAAGLGLLALLISWGYSAPPVRLLDTGWGELATSVVVAGVVPLMGLFVNGGQVTAEFAVVIVMLVTIHFAMMLAFAIPDLETDRAAGKTPLAVRLGPEATRRMLMAAVVATIVVAALGFALGVIETLLPVPVALVSGGVVVWAAGSDRPRLLTASAVAALVGMAVVFLV